MPIRFRCKYCNQLMGIARRKVGTEVECPTCKGKLLVPQRSVEDAPSPEPAQAPVAQTNSPPPFEGSDFGDLFNPSQSQEPVLAGAQQTAAPARPQQPAPQQRALRLPSSYDMDSDPLPGATASPLDANTPGILLSPGRATLLTVAIILGFALAFSAGLLVGKALQ